MSKSRIRRPYELGELSPLTAKNQLVFSSIKIVIDPENPTEQFIQEITPDAEDAIRVLRFLDEQNGIGWTDELKRIEKELRAALHDLMSVK